MCVAHSCVRHTAWMLPGGRCCFAAHPCTTDGEHFRTRAQTGQQFIHVWISSTFCFISEIRRQLHSFGCNAKEKPAVVKLARLSGLRETETLNKPVYQAFKWKRLLKENNFFCELLFRIWGSTCWYSKVAEEAFSRNCRDVSNFVFFGMCTVRLSSH